jgi:hypothetical protein
MSEVTIRSDRYGWRTFRHIASPTHRKRDGTETTIKTWQGRCVVCDAPFEITTPNGVTSPVQSAAFGVTTCPRHRRKYSRRAPVAFT